MRIRPPGFVVEVNQLRIQNSVAVSGALQPLIRVLRNVKGKLTLIRYRLTGTENTWSKQSLHAQLNQNVINYYSEALRLARPKIQVPDHVGCSPVQSTLLRTADGLLVNHKDGPHVPYTHGQMVHTYLKNVLQNKIGFMDGERNRGILDYGVELIQVTGESVRKDPPFVIYEPFRQGKHLKGNDRWTGFAMELLKHLSVMNHFDYVVKPVEDRKFGTFDETTGKWDGLIGELVYKVWISVLVAYLVVSLTLFLLGRVTPHEWYARHPCSPAVENQFTLFNSFWFTVGSLMQQGCDISPRATSTRIIGTIWWFFILIMVSSYTANLAAFLTIDRMETEIENVEDLTRQTKIKYGTLYGGSTYAFFKVGLMLHVAI
ncbi:unnamed protein product [Dicrocoelium dendriticum]|nr:unnamed protein product [Dicrocoelium dendriticum]